MQLVFSWAPQLAKSVRVNIGSPVVRTDGRSAVGVRSRDYQIFWVDLLSYGAPPRRTLRARVELRYETK